MNVIQNKSCLLNGHLKDRPNKVSIDNEKLDTLKYGKIKTFQANEPIHLTDNKIKFSEKLKVLLENRGGNEKIEYDDPYAFNDVDQQFNHSTPYTKNSSNSISSVSSKNAATPRISVTSKQISDISHLQVNNTSIEYSKSQVTMPLHMSVPVLSNNSQLPVKTFTNNVPEKSLMAPLRKAWIKAREDNTPVQVASKPISPVIKSSGKPLSFGKLQNAFTQAEKKGEKKFESKEKLGSQTVNNLKCGNSIKRAKPTTTRSLSLDSDLIKNSWNSTNYKKSLLEESLLGLKNYGMTKDVTDVKPKLTIVKPTLKHLQTGTTTVIIPTKSRKEVNLRLSSRHKSLQRIWTVRNKIVRLKNDYKQYVTGPDLGHSEADCDSDADGSNVQSHWFSLNSDRESFSYHDRRREAKLSQMKLEFRHKLKQLDWLSRDEYRDNMADVLINSARVQPNLTALLIRLCKRGNSCRKKLRFKSSMVCRSLCSYTDTSGNQCDFLAIPCASYCQQHIVYCKEQMLFTTCSAKKDDNTPCRAPVLDNIVESPLCLEHKRQKLLSQKPKNVVVRPMVKITQARKRSRSTTGRSRKRKRPIKDKRDTSLITTNSVHLSQSIELDQLQKGTKQIPSVKEGNLPFVDNPLSNLNAQVISKNDIDESQEVEVGEEVLAIVADLPLDSVTQATRLLEEQDFTNVLNHIPADAFNDLFTEDKGQYEPTPQETEELERALEAVDKDVKSLEKLSETQGILETLLDDQALVQTLAQLPEVPVFYQNGFSIDPAYTDVSKNLSHTILLNQANDNNFVPTQTADVLQS